MVHSSICIKVTSKYIFQTISSTVILHALIYEIYSVAKLTHWVRVTHICVGNLINIAPDNGSAPGRRQAIIWTNAGISLIRPLGTNLSEILIEIYSFSFNEMHLKMSSPKRRPFYHGLNGLRWKERMREKTKINTIVLSDCQNTSRVIVLQNRIIWHGL